MPLNDLTVQKVTGAAPTIDAVFDGEEVWGEPLYALDGMDDVYNSTIHYFDPGLTPKYIFDRSWAVTDHYLWVYDDKHPDNGSVQAIQNAKYKLYARWDNDTLYMLSLIHILFLFCFIRKFTDENLHVDTRV